MRILIWQQFSGNHSSHFELVGQFESVEEATIAAHELQAMLKEIGAWWEQFDNDQQQAKEKELSERGQLTPPEYKYMYTYSVDWWRPHGKNLQPLDWPRGEWAVKAVTSYQNLVFVVPSRETHAGSVPFEEILRRLGAKVAASHEEGASIALTLHCLAPDEAKAIEIASLAKEWYLDTNPPRRLLFIPLLTIDADWFLSEGRVVREGRQLRYENLVLRAPTRKDQFHNRVQGVVAFIEFLEQQGCTNITYTFETRWDNVVNEERG